MIQSTQTEPVIHLTANAAEQVKVLLAQEENRDKILRVYVEGGGCAGMQYGLVFDEQRQDDLCIDLLGVRMVVDAGSAKYLRGSTVDYVDSLTGGGFKVRNPKAKQSCGCGKSFEV